MSNDNRKPTERVAFFDGINPTNIDFQDEQTAGLERLANSIHDFSGSGILQTNLVTLPPILDTLNPNLNNISYSKINAGRFDGSGLFVDRQPLDTTYGDQLLITVSNITIPLYSQFKIIVFGKIYDPIVQQGIPILETIVFDQITSKATFNYFKSIISVFVTNFSGGIGRTTLNASAQTSLNTSIPGLTGRIVIQEVGPLQVLDNAVVLHQTGAPNLDVRDFITSTITRSFEDELNFIVNTAQNTHYVPASLNDVTQLALNTTGIAAKPFLDKTTNGAIYGQKVFLATNNIQQLSFTLSLADDAYGWSGELVVGVRPLQTKSINQFANKVDLDPDINILFEASFTQSDLLSTGYILTKTPQEIRFNFIGSAVTQPNNILTPNQYYVITISRRADISVGKIFIDAGPKSLTNSKFTSFNPSTKAWTDDVQTDLWFKVYSAAIRVTAGMAYMVDGTMVSLQKTAIAPDGSIISAIAGPYSLATIDPVASDNIVVLEATEAFELPSSHPRTGNLVFLRIIDKATINIFNKSDFSALVASTNDVNNANYPIVLAVINDLNNKTNQQFSGTITLPGQIRKNQIILFNTGLADNLLEINNVIIPNAAATGISYRIVESGSTTQYLGDFNNDKLFTVSDLVEQAIVQDTFSSESTNTFTGTSFEPYSLFDARSRDAIGFGKESIEDFILADVDGYFTINSSDVARLQYFTTTLPALITPAPLVITIQVLTVENITNTNIPILVTQITNNDGYAKATFPDQLAFTAINVNDMRAISINDTVNLSTDNFATTSYSELLIKKFVQRNDLIIETRFLSSVVPVIDTSYVLTFYNQNPVFNGKLGVFGEIATEVLEFVAPGINLLTSNILAGDIVQITTDVLAPSRNGVYAISQVIDAVTFRVAAPPLTITAGTANAGIEIFANNGIVDKLNDIAVIQFTLNNIDLVTANIQAGDKVHITLGPVDLNGLYTIARVAIPDVNGTPQHAVFTVVPPIIPLIAQTFIATFEFRDSADIIIKVAPDLIINAIIGNGPTPVIVAGMLTLAPASLPDGIDSIFTYSVTHVPTTGTVLVHWISGGIVKTMTFDAAPVQITGDGNPAGSVINRVTGTITIDTFQPPDAETPITTDYRIAPTVTLKHCYPTVISATSINSTDIEFKVPFINAVADIDIHGILGDGYVIVQTNNADPPNVVLDGYGNVVAGAVQANSINPSFSVIPPSRNMVLQLTDVFGNAPNIASGSYWMRIFSGTRINLPVVQKEFLSDTLGLSSPIMWKIQKNNFEWLASNMVITDCRRFLPTAFVQKTLNTTYGSKNEMWMPSDLFIGGGEIFSAPGVPYHGDWEITTITIDLPITALLSNNINVYNNLIASYAPTPGFTRAGYTAMRFSDGSFVGANDNGPNTALTKNQVRITPTISSIFLDGYKITNAPTYTDLDQVITKLQYQIRAGTYFDSALGIMYFHLENVNGIFEDEAIVQTGVCRINIQVALKKSGFANAVISINSIDIGRLFTNPVNIIPVSRFSIAGEIVAGFTVGVTKSNPDG